ncbi:MAG TPA: hypothetical protein DEV81_11900 [Cyanobacteria bacterium UBA11049]|nr:hypothetical protein [Cyanobacteria bacterium UBA11049]
MTELTLNSRANFILPGSKQLRSTSTRFGQRERERGLTLHSYDRPSVFRRDRRVGANYLIMRSFSSSILSFGYSSYSDSINADRALQTNEAIACASQQKKFWRWHWLCLCDRQKVRIFVEVFIRAWQFFWLNWRRQVYRPRFVLQKN